METAKTETEKEAPKPQLAPNATAFQQAEYERTVYVVRVEKGVDPKVLEQDPAYWAHHSPKLKPWDRLEVRAEDGTWYAEYLVLDSSRNWTRVRRIMFVALTTPDVAQTQANVMDAKQIAAQFEVKHRGSKGWSVLRLSDGAVIKEGMAQRDDANAWLATFVQAELGKGVHPDRQLA